MPFWYAHDRPGQSGPAKWHPGDGLDHESLREELQAQAPEGVRVRVWPVTKDDLGVPRHLLGFRPELTRRQAAQELAAMEARGTFRRAR